MVDQRLVQIVTTNHLKSSRNYAERAGGDKPKKALIAKQYDVEYWDGERDTGYGGYRNDGRWKRVCDELIKHYDLNQMSNILDIGCGKGFLLSEFKNSFKIYNVQGIDISQYAIDQADETVKEVINKQSAQDLSSYKNKEFDLVVSINTLHNLYIDELVSTLSEIERISKKSYICIESYRTEEEKWNLMRWQLTCECFFTPKEWKWIFDLAKYKGDYEFIYFT